MEKKRKNHVHLRITVEKESIDNIIRDNKLAFLYDTINEIEKKVYTYDEMDWNDALKTILYFADKYLTFEVSLYAVEGSFKDVIKDRE